MSTRTAVLAAILLAASIAVLWMWSDRESDVPVAPPADPPPAEAAPDLPVVRYEPPVAVRHPSGSDRRRLLELPNGEFVPALNGVVDAPALGWDPARPYSPIVGIERDSRGEEWYVHADQTRSITRMVFRSDTGRLEASTSTSHPERAVAVEPGQGPAGGTPAGSARR